MHVVGSDRGNLVGCMGDLLVNCPRRFGGTMPNVAAAIDAEIPDYAQLGR
jgi:hypothetical protein